MSLDLIQLRQSLRRQRRQINHFQQQQSEQRVLQRLRQNIQFRQAKRIGLYLDAFGEIQTTAIIHLCFQLGKTVYLPKICNMNQCLVWVRISQHQFKNQRFSLHRLGMLEPTATRGLHVSKLDVLIMPLLACDMVGTRIGMGGGFYDRSLANAPQRPFRLGIAHEFQFIPTIFKRQSWDQPIHALLTPHTIRNFK